LNTNEKYSEEEKNILKMETMKKREMIIKGNYNNIEITELT